MKISIWVNFYLVDVMEGLLFVVFWLGGAALHTLYDLKIKHLLESKEEAERSRWMS